MPLELKVGFMWNLIICQWRINWRMASRPTGWIHMKWHDFQIKNQLKNCLKSSRMDSYETWSFSMTNQLKNGLESFRLGSYEMLWLFNQKSIKEWSPENSDMTVDASLMNELLFEWVGTDKPVITITRPIYTMIWYEQQQLQALETHSNKCLRSRKQ